MTKINNLLLSIENLCAELNTTEAKAAKSKRKWIYDFSLSYDSQEKQWSAAIYNYLVLSDGSHDGGYEIAAATATQPEKAIESLLNSEKIADRLTASLTAYELFKMTLAEINGKQSDHKHISPN